MCETANSANVTSTQTVRALLREMRTSAHDCQTCDVCSASYRKPTTYSPGGTSGHLDQINDGVALQARLQEAVGTEAMKPCHNRLELRMVAIYEVTIGERPNDLALAHAAGDGVSSPCGASWTRALIRAHGAESHSSFVVELHPGLVAGKGQRPLLEALLCEVLTASCRQRAQAVLISTAMVRSNGPLNFHAFASGPLSRACVTRKAAAIWTVAVAT